MVNIVGKASKSLSEMQHDKSPEEVIRETVGDVSEIEVTGVGVLIGTYVRPAKTKSGLYLTEKYRDEDVYQGKVGLVLKVAPGAFEDGADVKFHGFKSKPGDWVTYFVGDGRSLLVRGYHCRLVEDVHVRLRIPNPDLVM